MSKQIISVDRLVEHCIDAVHDRVINRFKPQNNCTVQFPIGADTATVKAAVKKISDMGYTTAINYNSIYIDWSFE